MRNEAEHIEGLLADIAAQDFRGDVDVFIADGSSTDDSAVRAARAAHQHGISLTILDNPKRWVSEGLNECIRQARGDLIVRLDCHSRYPPDYLRRCALASEDTGAEVVGGIFVPRGRTPTERAIASAMESPFGGIHWMRQSSSGLRHESDIAVYGAFRPEAFALAGLFDPSLVRNQDDEFTMRLRVRGGRVVCDPAIHVYYTPRSSFRALFRQYFEYGRWKVPIMLRYRRLSSLRSLAPIGLLGSIATLAPIGARSGIARRILLVECALYVACDLSFSTFVVRRRDESWVLLPRVLGVFPTFHLSYGLGMLTGFAASAGRSGPKPSRSC